MFTRLCFFTVLVFGYSTVFAKICKVENHGGLVGHQYSQPYKIVAENSVEESFKTIRELLVRVQQLKENKYCTFEIAASCSETMELNTVRNFYTVKIGKDLINASLNSIENREVLVRLISLGICPSIGQ